MSKIIQGKEFNEVRKMRKEKNYKYREVYKIQKKAKKDKGWENTTEEEKQKHGSKKYMGGTLTLMRKEVA